MDRYRNKYTGEVVLADTDEAAIYLIHTADVMNSGRVSLAKFNRDYENLDTIERAKHFGHIRSETPFPAAATMVIVRPEEYAQFEAFKRGEREAARAVKDAMQECEYWRFKYEKAAKGARYKFAWDTTQFQPCSHPDISYCDDSCVKAIHDSIEKGWCAQKC